MVFGCSAAFAILLLIGWYFGGECDFGCRFPNVSSVPKARSECIRVDAEHLLSNPYSLAILLSQNPIFLLWKNIWRGPCRPLLEWWRLYVLRPSRIRIDDRSLAPTRPFPVKLIALPGTVLHEHHAFFLCISSRYSVNCAKTYTVQYNFKSVHSRAQCQSLDHRKTCEKFKGTLLHMLSVLPRALL